MVLYLGRIPGILGFLNSVRPHWKPYKTILDNQTHLKIGGGMKQVFEKPSAKRKKMT